MDTSKQRAMGPVWRGRLIFALVVFAALALLCAWGVGETLHGWSETRDSLEHWQARLAEPSGPTTGFEAPAARVRRLEEELDAVPERLFARGGMFLFSIVLLVLGFRKLRADLRLG